MTLSDFQTHKAELMQDPAFVTAYEATATQYELARQVIAARIDKGLTQQQLADLVGTSQANISKLEHAELNPSLAFVQKIAGGLGKKLAVSLE